MRISNPYNEKRDPTSHYAWDIVSGRIVAGRYAILACKRHLNDIRDGEARGLFWKPEEAERVIGFFPAVLRVTAGEAQGRPFHLISYTTFVVGCLFGWFRADGRRRFRRAWVETGKGQIKSPLAAAIGLYLCAFDGVPRAECYAIAKDRNQANVLFGDAVAMVNAPMADRDDNGESLIDEGVFIARGTGDMTWMLEHTDEHGGTCKFRALAGDEKISGPRPIYVAADEIHDWKNDGPLRTWRSAGAKMASNFLLFMSTNTPANDQLVGTEYSEECQRILRGEIRDDASFGFIARVDEKDDPMNDESCWIKAMPCLGITFPIDNVRMEVESSKNSHGTRLNTERLYFGIPVGSSEYWIDLDSWNNCLGNIPEDDLIGRPCWLSLDLSLKNDLTALGIDWELDDGSYAKVKYWRPEQGVELAETRDNARYRQWKEEGYIEFTPGQTIEYDFVAAEVQRICAVHNVQYLAFDPAHMGEFIKACDRLGFQTWTWKPEEPFGLGLKMVIHGQGKEGMYSTKALWMPRSLGQLEDAILRGDQMIEDNPITNYCAANAAVKADERGNRYFIKKSFRGRIDGVVVLAMVRGAQEAELPSLPAPNLDDFLANAVVVKR